MAASPPGLNPFYLETGLQYYLTGRWGALHGCSPVAANLFHHSIEMLMKARLLERFTEAQLKDSRNLAFGHNLPNLWREFKTTVRDPALHTLDHVLTRLNQWEDLRYPPAIPTQNIQWDIPITKAQLAQRLTQLPPNATSYVICVEELDELFTAIILAMQVQGLVQARLSNPRVVQLYWQQNTHTLW